MMFWGSAESLESQPAMGQPAQGQQHRLGQDGPQHAADGLSIYVSVPPMGLAPASAGVPSPVAATAPPSG